LCVLIHLAPPVLRFYALDWNLVAPDCPTTLSEAERRTLELAPGEPPTLRLALVTWLEGEHPTVNLLAPVVLNPTARRGLQVIQFESSYSCRHPLVIERDSCS
jgi:flagellar assembly factor FliW